MTETLTAFGIEFTRGADDAHLLLGKIGGKTFRRENPSEAYVCVPPALLITDSDGGTFTLGGEYVQRGWVFEFNVLRNDVDTGEMASKIEYRGGIVRIFGVDGWRSWGRARRSFV